LFLDEIGGSVLEERERERGNAMQVVRGLVAVRDGREDKAREAINGAVCGPGKKSRVCGND
jgi:hypothetical protein